MEGSPNCYEQKKESPGVQRRVCQEQSDIRVGIIIPSFHETMIPSGLRKTKSIVFNDFVPVIALNEQPMSFALLGEKCKPSSWSDV